jgi:DUF2934 family protein
MIRDDVRPAFIIVSADQIAERAYGLYQARGYADGFDREDWFCAERELKSQGSGTATVSRRSSKRAAKRG